MNSLATRLLAAVVCLLFFSYRISAHAQSRFSDRASAYGSRTHQVNDLAAIDWDAVMPGDTLLLTQARYSRPLVINKSGTRQAPLVIRSEKGTVISAEGIHDYALRINGAQTDLVFQHIVFERGAATTKYDGTVQICPGAHRLRFEDCEANDGAANGFFGEGSGADSLRLIRCRARGNARRGVVAPGSTRTGFLAQDCLFEFNRSDGLLINSRRGAVRNCRFVGNGMIDAGTPAAGDKPKHAIYMYPYRGGAEDWVIEDCIMDNNRGSGARIAGRNHTFRRNTVINSPVFIYVTNNDGVNAEHIITHNTFGSIDARSEFGGVNYGPGVQISGVTDLTFENNDLTGAGVNITAENGNSSGVVVRNNRIELTLDDRFVGLDAGQSEGFRSSDNVFAGSGSVTDLRWRYEGVSTGMAPWKEQAGDQRSVFVGTAPPSSSLNKGGSPANDWQLFPNPTSGQLHLELPTQVTAQIMMVNTQGSLVLKQQRSLPATLDLSQHSPGLYFLVVRTSERTYRRTVVVRP